MTVEDRLTPAQRQWQKQQTKAVSANETKPWTTTRRLDWNTWRLADLTEAHNGVVNSVRRLNSHSQDFSSAIDIIGLYVRWQRQRIDRLERLLVQSGTLSATDLASVGDFDRNGPLRDNDVVAHLTRNVDISALFDAIDELESAREANEG